MRSKAWLRIGELALAAGLLAAPLGSPNAYAQEGPQPPVQQQPEPNKAPSTAPGQPEPQKQPPPPQVSISVQSNLVNVDAVVTDQDGNLVTGLKRENFRILDDGQPQQVTNFSPSEAPITVVILLEYSSRYWGGVFSGQGAYWADIFLNDLKPQDWVALKTFDLQIHLNDDFTQDKRAIDQSLRTLGFPTFHEAVLFDAVMETIDQMRDVKGKKSILILATGTDTFSKHNLDQILNKLKETDVTIFSVGTAEAIDLYSANGGGIAYLQAKNQLTTFARMTGGYAFFPRFQGEMPDIFNTVAQYLRNQYTLGFSPNTPQDGRFHKLNVEVVDDQGNPMQLANKKGKMKKAVVTAREGYVAPRPTPGG